jgi:glycosyltransferase involved in cell wall biosynthesis
MKKVIFLLCATIAINIYSHSEKPFAIVVASYNNAEFFQKNLDSIFNQNYSNYRVIYIDAASTDGTYEKVKNHVTQKEQWGRFTLSKNTVRKKPLENWFNAIHSCKDHEIIVEVDGDDFLAHPNVLKKINSVYNENDIWITFGNYQSLSDKKPCAWGMPVPSKYIKENNFRKWPHLPIHLRTFYAWLFKKIKKEDLLDDDGKFYQMTGDVAMLLPMMEMAGYKHKFIKEILYLYNDNTSLNEHKINQRLQLDINKKIRSKKRYSTIK